MSDEEIQRLQAAWAALPRGQPASGCAPPEEIWFAVEGKRSEAQVRRLLEHSISCVDCSALWRLARELNAAARDAATPIPLWTRARRSPWVVGGGVLAAAAVLVLAISPRVVRRDVSTLRGSESEVLQPAGETVLRRAHPVLRWGGAPEGSRYAVSVSTSDLTMLYRTGDLSNAELELPPNVLAGLPAGATIVWRVDATLPDGRRLRSRAFLSRLE